MSEDNVIHLPNSNVVELDVETTVDIPPKKILESAADFNLTEVLVIGTTEDGDLFFSSSSSDVRDVTWLLSNIQNKILNMDFSQS